MANVEFYFSKDNEFVHNELEKTVGFYEKLFSKYGGEFNNTHPFFLTVDNKGERIEFRIPELKILPFECSKKYRNFSYIYFDDNDDEIRYKISFPNEINGTNTDDIEYNDVLNGLEEMNSLLDSYNDFVTECKAILD